MSNHVPGFGPPNARIALVGEAPGYTEEHEGRPFVGSSGQLLTSILSTSGIPRDSCYITNVIKTRPPNNDFGVYYEDKDRKSPTKALLTAYDDLRAELLRIKPNITVALGGEALRALTGRVGITKWRGSLIDTPVGKVLGTFHPASILRKYEQRTIAQLDLRKASRESTTHTFVDRSEHLLLDPSFEEVKACLGKHRVGGNLQNIPNRISVDIETVGTHVRCIGIGWSGEDALCIPITSNKHSVRPGGSRILVPDSQADFASRWTIEEEFEILSLLDKLFRNPKVSKVFQNYPFDATILSKDFGFEIVNLWMDSMLVQHSCYSELPKSLDFLASVYTNLPHYSDHDASDDMSEWRYNCRDCLATFQAAIRLEEEAKELNVWDHYKNIVEPAMLALTRAQNRGIDINLEMRKKLHEVYTQGMLKDRTALGAITGQEDFNPDSPKQVKELLFDKLRIPVVRDRITGNPTTNAKAINALRVRYPQHDQTFSHILNYRSFSTIRGTFLEGKLNDRGQMETSYNIGGTVNGRLSSATTIFGVGGNLQNIPKGAFRRMFIPPRGCMLIRVDLAQAEARVVAWTAPLLNLVKRWADDPAWDIMTWNAAENIYHIPESEVTKEQRQVAKAGVHGGNYGMMEKTAALQYKIPVQQAKMALAGYRSAVNVDLWWQEVQQTLINGRTLRTPMGRHRIFLDRLNENTYRSAYSFIPQAIVADIIAVVFARAEETLQQWRSYPLLQVHDEIVFVCPQENLSQVLPKIRPLFRVPVKFPKVEEPLVIPCEVSYGPNWFDQTEWKG